MLWTLNGNTEEKFEIAARAGLQAVGFTSHRSDWSQSSIKSIKNLARSYRMRIACLPGNPSWRTRDGAALGDAGNHTRILSEVRENLRIARALEAENLILISGRTRTGLSENKQWTALTDICGQCAELLEETDVKLLVEPVSDRGVFLRTCQKGAMLARQVNHPRLRLLFNTFHEQTETGNIIETIKEAAPFTAMFRIADSPGRTEPGTGELHFPNIYRAIGESPFRGYAALDFQITHDPVETLIRVTDEMRAALRDVKKGK